MFKKDRNFEINYWWSFLNACSDIGVWEAGLPTMVQWVQTFINHTLF